MLATLPLVVTTAHAEIAASTREWEVKPDFRKSEDARREISGAACVTGTSHCIAVNDKKNMLSSLTSMGIGFGQAM